MKKNYVLIYALLLLSALTACSDTNKEQREIDPNVDELANYKESMDDPLKDLAYDIYLLNDENNVVNQSMVLMNTTEKMSAIVSASETLVSNANKNLITFEDIESIPEKYKESHKNLLESIEQYRDSLQQQYLFFSGNQSKIPATNELFLEENLFAVSESIDLDKELESVRMDTKFSVQNLEQRVNAFKEKLNK